MPRTFKIDINIEESTMAFAKDINAKGVFAAIDNVTKELNRETMNAVIARAIQYLPELQREVLISALTARALKSGRV